MSAKTRRDDDGSISLLCDCGLPYATLRDGVLYVVSRHSGVKHTNAIAVLTLLEIAHDARLSVLLDKVLRHDNI